MCGRISLFAPPDAVRDRFAAEPVRPLEPRYNVAPGRSHPVVLNDDPETIRFPTWGLVPAWSDDGPSSGHVNARAETLAEKPSFREAYAERRCLVLVDGFYDWKETPTGKQPYRFEREDRRPFALAGLWEPASGAPDAPDAPDAGGAGVAGDASDADGAGDARDVSDAGATFTVVTTEPNAVVEPVHHRMPVVLDREEERRWLRGGDGESASEADADELADLLSPSPTPDLRAYPVSSAVNSPENDAPDVIEEVPAEEDVQTGLDEF